MCETIKRNYWFPKMRAKVNSYVRNCLKCIAFASKSGKIEGLLNPISKGNALFETIHVDHLGPIHKNNSVKICLCYNKCVY